MHESKNDSRQIQIRTLDLILQNSAMTGAKVLLTLMEEPDRPWSVLELARRVFRIPSDPERFTQISKHAFPPVPLADSEALRGYLRRKKELQGLKEAGQGDPGLDWELDWLTKELRRITRPRGGIKNAHPELRSLYACIKMGLQRFLAKAKQEDPEIFLHLKKHLQTGLTCYWHSDLDTF